MGVHARRVARRKTPLVAAAAGIGTVAAMLAVPAPASAAGLVLDPTYGGKDGVAAAGAFSGNTAGLIPARGVDAVDVGASSRVVLGQDGSGLHKVSLTKFKPDGTIDDTFGGGTGQVVVTVPASTTVSRLLLAANGTHFWVLGSSPAGLVAIHLDAAGAPVDAPSAALPGTGFGLPATSTFTIVDAKTAVEGPVVALNVVSSTGAKSAVVLRFSSSETLDATFNVAGAPAGSYVVPTATTIGGLAVRPSGGAAAHGDDVVGTFQAPSPDPTAEPSGESGVFELDPVGVPLPGFGASGISMAIEEYADSAAPDHGPAKTVWTTEVLGEPIATGANNGEDLLVAGRVGSSSFLANLDPAGALRLTSFGRFGGAGATGGGGITTVPTSCNAGALPHVVEGLSYYYLANVCASNHAELVRVSLNGVPDTNFNAGSAVWQVDAPVNARPVSISNNQLRIGSSRADGSDVATAAFAEASAPSAPTVTVDNSVVVAGNPVTLFARPNVGDPGTPAPTFRWESRGSEALHWVPVLGSATQTISGTTSNTLRVTTNGSMDGTEFRAIAVNVAGESPSAATTALTVLPIAPVISQQPANESGPEGGTVMFTAAATSDPPATWTWQSQAPGDTLWHDVVNGGSNVMGADTAVLTLKNITAVQSGTHYRATAVAGGYAASTDGRATLTIGGVTPPTPPVPTPPVPTPPLPTPPLPTPPIPPLPGYHPKGDYNGDGMADMVTFRPWDGSFHWSDGTSTMFGQRGDKPVVGDFNGDGKADAALYRPSNGTWYIAGQPSVAFGRATDIPVPGDYHGDGKTEEAVYRPSNGTWYIKGMAPIAFGRSTDIPVPAKYKGDGKTSIAVYRPSNGRWYFPGGGVIAYGRATDIPVPADYAGDGKAQIALFRPSNGNWYLSGQDPVVYGQRGDIPVPNDYSGSGHDQIAVYRPWDSTFNVRGSVPVVVGMPGDVPLH